jgi:hypothetical protein
MDGNATPWLAKALPNGNLEESDKNPSVAPLPLSSALAIEPLSDLVSQIIPRIIPSSMEDVHPFQVLPVYLNLQQDRSLDSPKEKADGVTATN